MVTGQLQIAPDGFAPLRQLAELLRHEPGFREVIEAIQRGETASFDGACGSACALVAAALSEVCPSTTLVVCPRAADIDKLADDLAVFSPLSAVRFPAWESEPGERLVYDDIYSDRLRTLKRLMYDPPRIVLSSIQSLLQPSPPVDAIRQCTRTFQLGDEIDEERLSRWLIAQGFHATSAVELPGEFSRRGGIFDIFAPEWTVPARIELFGDVVDSIRSFDVTNQRSIEKLTSIDVTILPSGADSDMRAAEQREHLAAYLAKDAWVILVEPDQIGREGGHYIERLDDPGYALGVGETLQRLGDFGTALVSTLATSTSETHCSLGIQTVERFSGEVSQVRLEIEQAAPDGDVVIVAETEAELTRLGELFHDSTLVHSNRLHLVRGGLQAGFELVNHATLVVSDNQLFQRSTVHRRVRRHLGKKIDSFMDLREGDLVVHLSHGIGRFRGMQLLSRDNQVEEHLAIEFQGGTKVYVPATNIQLVQKYVGATKARPRLAKIGGANWMKRRQAAESAVADMAADLLELQAKRMARPGIGFSTDTEWQREFDASFPYQETPDQLAAVSAIKEDMETPRPMDRLLCGDVGFGKTELSMRAAFKAIDNGYQVAVLVPTTILAEQHYRTFVERMAAFPFHISKLSRFCTTQQQRDTVAGLADGTVDMVIGTHRLASKDVRFQNLGLVIIDEEQRFGVEVKERLKSMRSVVDILTMTATPIPRTLHMSLTGLREISNLETPPEDRIAVETRLLRWEEPIIRHAILREINRSGQVYFVHNRVNDIEALRKRLQEIVPEARIRVGHGQMPESELEEVMLGFVKGEFDVLLATTIVESGLDIPNANTIFIDEAYRYGLADLHQLRGRVGRYKHRAYCYLLIDGHKHVTPEAARRLRAIEEYSQMGAGFAIAMRDLEFRGAGNVLGTQQSGHIAAVGYELYCQLLEAAVRRLKELPPQMTVEVNIDLPGEAFLSDEYVPDQRMKIDLYRRLSRIASEEDVQALRDELEDRFGAPPEPARRMMDLVSLKVDAAVWQIESIFLEDRFLVFRYTDRARITQLAKLTHGRLRVVDAQCAYLEMDYGLADADRIYAQLRSVLRTES